MCDVNGNSFFIHDSGLRTIIFLPLGRVISDPSSACRLYFKESIEYKMGDTEVVPRIWTKKVGEQGG